MSMDEYERRVKMFQMGYKTSGQRWVEDLERQQAAEDAFGTVVGLLLIIGVVCFFIFV